MKSATLPRKKLIELHDMGCNKQHTSSSGNQWLWARYDSILDKI